MRDNLRDYARLGLVHHMLYPRSLEDPDDHVLTLEALIQREDIETFDCCLPYGETQQARLIPRIRNSGKTAIAYATHLFPLRKIPFTTPFPQRQAQARAIVADMVRQAAAIGATGFIFASGGPPPPEATAAHQAAFADFCRWLCRQLQPHGITAMLEPFDTTIDKRFLYGPTHECVRLLESLRPDVDNFGIELDVAHVPLMGETFAQAIHTTAPYLRRVHLGNCVLRDKQHPRYGDTHPPIGYEAGEIDVPELVEILRLLREIGFLNKERRGDLILEVTPWPGKTEEETVADNWQRLDEAWGQV